MSNPSKQLGTAWESEIVRLAQAAGFKAWRLAEAGENDPGDVAIETPEGDHYIIEAKCRTNLNAHVALEKATDKAYKADLPFSPTGVALAWKRLTHPEPGKRRVQEGQPVVVISVAEYLELIGR